MCFILFLEHLIQFSAVGVNFSSILCRGEENADPEVALEFLAKRCQWAVVTLGPNGCIAKHGKEVNEMLHNNF
jgi:hypothetical protein